MINYHVQRGDQSMFNLRSTSNIDNNNNNNNLRGKIYLL